MPTEATSQAPFLTIATFDKALHDRSAFSCGHDPIDNFLKSSLSDQIKLGLVQAWIATAESDPAVLGFYALGPMSIRKEYGPDKWQRVPAPDIGVIYIRAVAVRLDMQGRHLGKALVVDAMKRCVDVADIAGGVAIVLDVLKDANFERRWKFYASLGFHPMNDPQNPGRVYIPMADVRRTLNIS